MQSAPLKHNRRRKLAFTLTEVLISLALLTLAIGASLTVLSMSMRSITSSEKHMEALHALRTGYEQIRKETHFGITNVWDGKNGDTNINGYVIDYEWLNLGNDAGKTWELTLTMNYEHGADDPVTKSMHSVLSESYHP